MQCLCTDKFASSRQSPRPRWSAFCNTEFEECSLLVWDSLFLVNPGGQDAVNWFGIRVG